MTSERWQRAKALFQAAVEQPMEERATFIATAVGDDDELRREVESLLAADAAGASLLDRLPLAGAAVLDAESTTLAGTEGNDRRRALEPGHRIGPYEISALIGAGGMGEVYRARDERLHRDVALKVLPEVFALDSGRMARFKREAQMLAALNHPNIGAIYGLEEGSGQDALVLELVEGSTLADRIAQGPLPSGEAFLVARQIADALAAAHEKRIVHRDLKPANVKITPAGIVKVLDFGLAKAAEWEAPSRAPSLAQGAPGDTREGVIVGTTSYMSPEQARGQSVDGRTDVWSFGCVLFEMLTGAQAFDGGTVAGTVEKILENEAPLEKLPRNLPAGIPALLRRCLEKDPERRLSDIAEAGHELERALTHDRRRFKRRVLVLAGLVAATAASLAVYRLLQPRPPSPLDRSSWVQLTNVDSAVHPALSSDGRTLAFIRGPSTFTSMGQIYAKTLPDGLPVQLTDDTFAKMGPVFSPQGDRIAYTVRDSYRWDTWSVPASGGPSQPWLQNASGLTWIGKESLLFSEIRSGSHMALVTADAGGERRRDVYVPQPVNAMAHLSYVSPDGRMAVVVEMDERGAWRPCRMVPIDGSSAGRPFGPSNARCTSAAWSPDGRWIYFSANAGDGFHLWRQLYSEGPAERITSGPTEEEGVAIAPDGRSLITSVGLNQRSVWFHDASGERQISLEGYAYWPLVTADGRSVCFRLAKTVTPAQAPSELWVADLASGQMRRLFEAYLVTGYDVSRDDRIVASVTEPDGRSRLWVTWIDGRDRPNRVPEAEGDNPRFTPSGEIVFRASGQTDMPLALVRADGTGRAILQGPELVGSVFGTVSPDGEWLSNHSGPGMSAVSLRGGPYLPMLGIGSRLRWSGDGKHVYLSVQTSEASAFGSGRTYVIPLAGDSMLPPVPPGGFRSEADLAALPGVEIIPYGDVAPGPSAGVYAFSRMSTTRNLYRIPLQSGS